MGLVLPHRVAALPEGCERPDDLWDELREPEQRQHRLCADLPNKVGATATVGLDKLEVGVEAFLDLRARKKRRSAVALPAGVIILVIREEREGDEA